MKFIGSDCPFNNSLRQQLQVPNDYTIISNIDGDYSMGDVDKKTILLLPISSELEYFSSTTTGSLRLKGTFFETTNICTVIYIYMVQYIDVLDVVNVINNFDKDSLVDCIWIYPRIENKLQFRNNNVDLLPYQQELKINYYLELRESKFLNESLTHYGMLLNNDKYNTVYKINDKKIPYISIREGIAFPVKLIEHIRFAGNVRVYKNTELVFEKIITENSVIEEINDTQVYDLYNDVDYSYVMDNKSIIDTNRPIYLYNTENIELTSDTEVLVGLCSGNVMAKLAYEHKLKHIVMFDYSTKSIDFQKELITSDNRLEVYKNHLPDMILGIDIATTSDLDRLDSNNDLYYDYLRGIKVDFIEIDLRNLSDIEKLFETIPSNSTLWISNVLNYITSIHVELSLIYDMIDILAKLKNITILPHTRVYYEG